VGIPQNPARLPPFAHAHRDSSDFVDSQMLHPKGGNRKTEKVGCSNAFAGRLARTRKIPFCLWRELRARAGNPGEIPFAGKTFVDAGANFGIYTMVASKLVGQSGRVIAFEPTAESFEVLRRNIALNGLTNVLAVQGALSDKAGTAWLHYGTDPVRNSLGKILPRTTAANTLQRNLSTMFCNEQM